MAKCPKCVGPVIKTRNTKQRECRRCGPIFMTAEQYISPESAALVYQLRLPL